ncbi:TorD/DmsD family molecular chaperone [Neobacillus notoginsengisoli]|nr:molecular chaperone TorD family protein [Neobacillus notoginsengisoli]
MAQAMEAVKKVEERLMYYQLFCHYYRGELNRLSPAEWNELAKILRETELAQMNGEAFQAIQSLEAADDSAIKTFEYDYNRLFVGPAKLLASPYESSYRNIEGTILQQETLNVRNFYHYVGLQVANEGQAPDDHIHYELEFILYLLTDGGIQEKNQVHKMFLEKHLLQWGFKHCERIVRSSENPLTRAMGILLKEFLQFEKQLMEGE